MPQKIRDVLSDLIETYGIKILEDPDRLSQFLEDRCKDHPDEAFHLSFALRYLLKLGWRPTDRKFLFSEGTERLVQQLGYSQKEAEAVASALSGALADASGGEQDEEPEAASEKPDEEFVAVPGNLRRISGGIANRPRTAEMRKKSFFSGLLMVAVVVVLVVLFFQIGSQRTPVGDELRIAFFAPMSGPEARLSHVQLRAAQLAVERINRRGVHGGYRLRVVGYDLPADAAKAEAAVKRVMKDKSILAMMLGAGGKNVSRIAEAADSVEAPLVTVAPEQCADVLMDGAMPWLYSYGLANDTQYRGKMLSYFSVQALKKKKIAIYYNPFDKISEQVYGSTRKWASGFGAKVVAELPYNGNTSSDGHSLALAALTKSGAELLILPGRNSETAEIIKEARKAGFEGPVVAENYTEELYNEAGASLRGSWWINEISALDPPVRSVLKDYRNLYNENGEPEDVAAALLAYDGIQWIASALESTPGFRGEAIRHTLLATRNLPLTHATLTVDPRTHQPLNKAMAVVYCARDKGIFQRRVRAGKD